MIEYIKNKLIEEPEKIKSLLETYDFHNIRIRTSYMSFGRCADSSTKSIVIRLRDNPNAIVHDYPRNITCDIFNYIIKEKGAEFRDVIATARRLLGIEGYYVRNVKREPFGGFYSKLHSKSKIANMMYDNDILGKYIQCCNKRFLEDNISLIAQRYYGIGFDVCTQSITIPIYDEVGNLIGVKCRRNDDDGGLKYFYDVPCLMSQTLYSYYQNYEWLDHADVVYVVEAEKGCMQAYTYGMKNFVAMGSGSISKKQVQLLLQLEPKKIVLLHDVGFEAGSILRNMEMIKGYSRTKEVDVCFWNYFDKDYEDKVSPTDMGKEKLEYIINNEIDDYETLQEIIIDEEML